MPAQSLPALYRTGSGPTNQKSSFSLEQAEPLFTQYQQQFLPKLTEALIPQIQATLKSLAAKNASYTQIASQASGLILTNIGKIQNQDQINSVIIDCLVQSLNSSVSLWTGKSQPSLEKIYQKVEKRIANLTVSLQADLEKAAVLASLTAVAKFKKPTTQLQSLILEQVNQFLEINYPLITPKIGLTTKSNIAGFLQNYLANLEKNLSPQFAEAKIPPFPQLQETKIATYNQSTSAIEKDIKSLAEQISYILGLLPIPEDKIATLGFGLPKQPLLPSGLAGFFARTMLFPDGRQKETYYSLLAHDKERLEETLKLYAKELPKSQILANAQNFALKKPTNTQQYSAVFQNLSGTNSLNLASQFAWFATEAAFGKYPGIYIPQDHLIKDIFLAQKIVGGLTHGV